MKNIFGILLIMICILTVTRTSYAQWVNTGMTNNSATAIVSSGTNLFASAYSGVFLSEDNGSTWSQLRNGISSSNVYALAISGANLFAGVYDGVYLSGNNGKSWTGVSNGMTYKTVWSLAVSGSNVFAGTFYGGIYRSSDNGSNWVSVNSGLTNGNIYSLAVLGTTIYAGTGGGIFRSTDNGANWTNATGTSYSSTVLVVSGTDIYASSNMGVVRSTNNGTNWTVLGNSGMGQNDIRALAVSGTNIFAGTWGGGIYHSTNNGISWTAVNTGLPTNPISGAANSRVTSLAVYGANLYAGIDDGSGGATNGLWRRPLSQVATAVDKNFEELPAQFTLSQNFPNPFNPSTTISFNLSSRSFVKLTITDALGREVDTIVSEELSAGSHSRKWNAYGIPSGVYFCRMQSGSFSEIKKLVLLR